MDEVIEGYVSISNDAVSLNKEIDEAEFGFNNIFCRGELKSFKAQIPPLLARLQENDANYSGKFKSTGAINDLNMLNAQLAVVDKARNMAMSSLANTESCYKDTESSLNFRLTTVIAITAIVISIAGLA